MSGVFSTCSYAEESLLRGHAKYTLSQRSLSQDDFLADNGGIRQTSQVYNARVSYRASHSAWSANGDLDLGIKLDDNTSVLRRDLDRNRLLDLSTTYRMSDSRLAQARIDRLSVAYTGDITVLKLGRQAVSWGNGFLFQPMDIFNPFSPVSIDKEYKTGDDMLYGQLLLPDGSDLQLIAIPRRDDNGTVMERHSSATFKFKTFNVIGDFDLLLARHYSDEIAGLGFSRPIRESIWRVDITATHLNDDSYVWSAVTNLDYSWMWLRHNVYGFAEYFHNGFGESDVKSRMQFIETYDPALLKRVLRGELFTLGQDYVSAGLQIELHPLLMFSPTVVLNLADRSGLIPLTLNYSWKQDLNLTFSAISAFGEKYSEYGSPASPGTTYTLLISAYF